MTASPGDDQRESSSSTPLPVERPTGTSWGTIGLKRFPRRIIFEKAGQSLVP